MTQVGIPAASKEVDYQGSKGEEVGRAHRAVVAGVLKAESGCLRSGAQDVVFDPRCEELGGRPFGDFEPLGLDHAREFFG